MVKKLVPVTALRQQLIAQRPSMRICNLPIRERSNSIRRRRILEKLGGTTFAQFFYWADIVKKLNDRLVEGRRHRDID